MDAAEKKSFRMLAAKLNYMDEDNPAIQFAAKEICRKMAAPVDTDFSRVKKLARFLVGICAARWSYPWQCEEDAGVLRVFADSDWAGCLRTRRSTSGV